MKLLNSLKKTLLEQQQKAFDVYMSITSNDDDFFQMCLAYQNGVKNNISMEIQDITFSL